ncbi:hypothetical protein FLAG1_05881 [Fusarium langsethiae]|uniref:Uncharacterized protein n=1 Tax=Fusarium langsethiae TaxID=179993 RepID=A0A0N0DEK8_FUSLA|nr:hypothetical protein FLAG1_05881 [Fusarium langsethiae]
MSLTSYPSSVPNWRGWLCYPTLSFLQQSAQEKKKRPRSSEGSGDDTQLFTKRVKVDHPAIPPPQFWDNLSRPSLTQNALRELNHRTTPISASRSSTSNLQSLPRTRRALAARSKTHAPSAQEFLRQSSPAGRTRVKRFARHGGPNLNDLRGYRLPNNHDMSSSQTSLGRRKRGSRSPDKSNTTTNTTTMRSTGPYDRAFQQHLIDHKILPPGYEYPDGHEPSEPDNMDEIRQALERPRASLSPSRFSKDDFKRFKRADDHATKESRVTASVIPIIEGDPGDTRWIASDISFTNLDHLTDGLLVCAKPDLYHRARPEQLHKEVRRALDNHIVPSTQDDLPVLPNNFVEVKGPDGAFCLTALKSRIMTIKLMLSHGVYHGGHMKAYSNHVLEPSTPEAPPGYAMTQIKGWSLTSDLETFRQGATAYRNGRDWAKKQRDEAIAEANKKVADIGVTVAPNNAARQTPQGDTTDTKSYDTYNIPFALRYDPETSEDELS